MSRCALNTKTNAPEVTRETLLCWFSVFQRRATAATLIHMFTDILIISANK